MQKKIKARTFAQESGPISRPQIHGSQLKLLYAHHSLAQPHKASREVYSVRRMKVSFGEDLNRKRLTEKRRKEKAMSRPWLASSPWPSGAVSNEADSQQLQRTYRALFGGTAGRRAAGCGGREGSTDTGGGAANGNAWLWWLETKGSTCLCSSYGDSKSAHRL